MEKLTFLKIVRSPMADVTREQATGLKSQQGMRTMKWS